MDRGKLEQSAGLLKSADRLALIRLDGRSYRDLLPSFAPTSSST